MTEPTMAPTFGDDFSVWLLSCWPTPADKTVVDDCEPERVEFAGNEIADGTDAIVWSLFC